jgi:hypothetical protein
MKNPYNEPPAQLLAKKDEKVRREAAEKKPHYDRDTLQNPLAVTTQVH